MILVLGILKTLGQFLIWLSQFIGTMRIGAIFSVMALLGLLEIFAHLCLVVIVGYVHHLVFELDWHLLVASAQFCFPVCEMT